MTRQEYGRSTEQIELPGFLPHGQANYLYADDDLFVVHAAGPFNREFVEYLIQIETGLLKEMSEKHARWYALTTITNSAMMTPDAMIRYAEYRQAMRDSKLNPQAIAFVLGPEVEGRQLMFPHFAKLYGDSGITFAEFTEEAPARDWLQTLRDA